MDSHSIIKSPSNLKRRKIINKVMLSLCAAASIITLIPLFYIFFYTISYGMSSIDLNFFTDLPKPVGEPGGGMANAIVGSLILIGIGSGIGIPVGILSGIYVNEYSKNIFANIIKFTTDVLSGIPSIVVGIFAYTVIVLPMQHFSALAGGFALGILMIPTITRITEEMLKLVPQTLREASLALGVPRWKTSLKVVLKTASGGIITGILLAIARIAGETAPLLFTSLGNTFWNFSVNEPIASVPVQIFNYAVSPYEDLHKKAWAGALILISMVVLINLFVRLISNRKYNNI